MDTNPIPSGNRSNKLLCIGGPADGELHDDCGNYIRVIQPREFSLKDLLPISTSEVTFEYVTYRKIAYRRKDGGIIYVYEEVNTDSMTEMWEFYLKNRKARR